MSKILVVGSMNMDLVVKTDQFPQKGETVKGLAFNLIPGGKGANQALAAAKLGGDVTFIGACGKDDFGKSVLSSLQLGGVNTDKVVKVDKSTGIAAITVEKDGDNRIIIVEGANGEVNEDLIDGFEEEIREAEVVLLQMEIPLDGIIHTIEIADRYNTKIVTDPAPARKLPSELYSKIDYLLPNETELNVLTDNGLDIDKKAGKLIELGVKNLIVTMGEKGVTLYSKEKVKHFKTVKVKAVDTTAAGDAFAGALAVGIENQWPDEKMIKYAMAAATLSVTKFGAQPSLPDREMVKRFIAEKGIVL